MTTELWLAKPCREHSFCDHDEWVRLDPEQVLKFRYDSDRPGAFIAVPVQGIIDALEEE